MKKQMRLYALGGVLSRYCRLQGNKAGTADSNDVCYFTISRGYSGKK